jgi:hypothetical protein
VPSPSRFLRAIACRRKESEQSADVVSLDLDRAVLDRPSRPAASLHRLCQRMQNGLAALDPGDDRDRLPASPGRAPRNAHALGGERPRGVFLLRARARLDGPSAFRATVPAPLRRGIIHGSCRWGHGWGWRAPVDGKGRIRSTILALVARERRGESRARRDAEGRAAAEGVPGRTSRPPSAPSRPYSLELSSAPP